MPSLCIICEKNMTQDNLCLNCKKEKHYCMNPDTCDGSCGI